MKKPITIMLASAAITAGALLASPAPAAPPAPVETNVSLVRTADLDLRSEAGRRQLDRRLASAARTVCGEASSFDLAGKNDVRRCRAETLVKADAQKARIVAAAEQGVIAVTAAR